MQVLRTLEVLYNMMDHLIYVFGEENKVFQLLSVTRILRWFLVPGLEVNINKGTIVGINVPHDRLIGKNVRNCPTSWPSSFYGQLRE